MGLFISYWRCNYTRKIRIMRTHRHSTPSTVAEIDLIGEKLTEADVKAAEALIEQITKKSIKAAA